MATIVKPSTFSAGATIIASEHNNNFDTIYNEFNGNIDNSNIKSSAAIVDTKLAQITTAAKVHGTSLTGLASVVSGAGVLPATNVFVSGMIMLWSGSIVTIPTGWLLCNGANGTPDLRNRFVIAAGDTYAVGATGDGTIISHDHTAGTLSADTGGAHTHRIFQSGNQSSTNYTRPSTVTDFDNTPVNSNGIATPSGGDHAHSISGSTAATGTGTTNIAIYYALAYIMKS